MRAQFRAAIALLFLAVGGSGCGYEHSAVIDDNTDTLDEVTSIWLDFGDSEVMPLTNDDIADKVNIDTVSDRVLHARGHLRSLPEVTAGELQVSVEGEANMRFVLAYRALRDNEWFVYYHPDHRSRPWMSFFSWMVIRDGIAYFESYPEDGSLSIGELGDEIELAIFAVPYAAEVGSYEYTLSAAAE